MVTAVAMLVSAPKRGYQVAYTIMSPKDTYKLTTALGNVGWRMKTALKTESHPFKFHIQLAGRGSIKPQKLASLIRLRIELDTLTGNVPASRRFKQDVSESGGNIRLSPSPDLPYDLNEFRQYKKP